MIETTKQAQRAVCLVQRRALSQEERQGYSAAICARLTTLPELRSAGIILSYRAMAEEADLSALHRWALERDKRLAFPVSRGQGRMEAWEPKGPESWRRGRYGIWEPDLEQSVPVDPAELDVVLLPCVGYDRHGRRLGHGGGYYDRYLPQCPGAKRILAAFSCQRVDRVVTDDHDQLVDLIVTEE